MVLPHHALAQIPWLDVPLNMPSGVRTWREIWYEVENGVCYLYFDFYNGAMSTSQCRRLQQALKHVESLPDVKVVVLMGGDNFFSNGIHLNTIEAAEDSIKESMENIVAIDDVCEAIMRMSNKITIASMRGNAGAGGVMMALAADQVYVHEGVVLNPHYRTMGLYGSEVRE
jgi:putative two-component system hydrogenase maturation factor HypX/HoxX